MSAKEAFIEWALSLREVKESDREAVALFWEFSSVHAKDCDKTSVRPAMLRFLQLWERSFAIPKMKIIKNKDTRRLDCVEYEGVAERHSKAPPYYKELMIEACVSLIRRDFHKASPDTLRSFAVAVHSNPEIESCSPESLRSCLRMGDVTGGTFTKDQLCLVVRRSGGSKILTVVESYRFLIELSKKNLGYKDIVVREFSEREVEGTNAECLYVRDCRIPYEFLLKTRRDLDSVEWVALFSGDRFLAKYRKEDLLERARIVVNNGVLCSKTPGGMRSAGAFWNGSNAYTDAVDMLRKTAIKEFLKLELNLDSMRDEERNMIRYLDIEQAKTEEKIITE